eukprot:g32298.t1
MPFELVLTPATGLVDKGWQLATGRFDLACYKVTFGPYGQRDDTPDKPWLQVDFGTVDSGRLGMDIPSRATLITCLPQLHPDLVDIVKQYLPAAVVDLIPTYVQVKRPQYTPHYHDMYPSSDGEHSEGFNSRIESSFASFPAWTRQALYLPAHELSFTFKAYGGAYSLPHTEIGKEYTTSTSSGWRSSVTNDAGKIMDPRGYHHSSPDFKRGGSAVRSEDEKQFCGVAVGEALLLQLPADTLRDKGYTLTMAGGNGDFPNDQLVKYSYIINVDIVRKSRCGLMPKYSEQRMISINTVSSDRINTCISVIILISSYFVSAPTHSILRVSITT